MTLHGHRYIRLAPLAMSLLRSTRVQTLAKWKPVYHCPKFSSKTSPTISSFPVVPQLLNARRMNGTGLRRSLRIQSNLQGSKIGDDPAAEESTRTGRKRSASTLRNAKNTTAITTTKKAADNSSKQNNITQQRGAAILATETPNQNTTSSVFNQVDRKSGARCEGLPRARERQLQEEWDQSLPLLQVIGVDEAGRGPLAGPVVAAAILLPSSWETIPGVVDSKKVTKEEDREAVYQDILSLPQVRWAVSIIDAARIDEINILQATLQGMKMAVTAVMKPPLIDNEHRFAEASIDHTGCYVICSSEDTNFDNTSAPASTTSSFSQHYHALIDGNRLPKEMPCPAESMVKGDSKECCIAAASILAKVTRDRLMHGYDKLYPQYNLQQHKGYPTAAHMTAVQEHGASPIHRRTFAPLKHMNLDVNGKIIVSASAASKAKAKEKGAKRGGKS